MPQADRPDWSRRLQEIDTCCAAHDLDVLVVSAPSNLRYLIGFTGSAGLLVTGPRGRAFVTDGRYEGLVREQITHGRFMPVDVVRVESRYDQTLAACLDRDRVARAGFEAGHVTVATLQRWQQARPETVWQPTEDAVERLRLVKDQHELATMRRAARALSDVSRQLGSMIAIGRTEREVAHDVDRAIERAGFERPAFETIVASGANTAYPHARPTDRRLAPGDLVLLDFGGVLDGYCVDLTRMAGIGRIGSAASALLTAVSEAHDAAVRTVRAGVLASDVDRAARQVIESHGLGQAFLHGTGHGLGLDVHEAPRLARAESGVRDVLAAGMVCTIEPGAYVAGVGGVRLEDDLLVTTDGCELLTEASRELIVI